MRFNEMIIKKILKIAGLGTAIFAGKLFLVEALFSSNPNYFSFYVTLSFFAVSLFMTAVLMRYTRALTFERTVGFSFLVGGLLILITALLYSEYGLLSTVNFPILRVGMENMLVYLLYFVVIAGASFWTSLKLNNQV